MTMRTLLRSKRKVSSEPHGQRPEKESLQKKETKELKHIRSLIGIAILLLVIMPAAVFAAGDLTPENAPDGEYTIAISTKTDDVSKVKTPAKVFIEDGQAVVWIEWYMKDFDTLEYNGVTYQRLSEPENTVFEIPMPELGAFIDVHVEGESGAFDYNLHFQDNSFRSKKEGSSWNIIPYGAAGAIGALLLYKGLTGLIGRKSDS